MILRPTAFLFFLVALVDIASLIYGKIILVTGKGGVGKTTTAAALGLLGAAQGRKTLVVEVDSQYPSLTPIFGRSPKYEPAAVQDNLWICNLDWYNALNDWVSRIVPAARVVQLILNNKLVHQFLDATPGNREVVTLSKLVWLCESFDLVVVDLPASGHAVSLLTIPGVVQRLFGSGPIRERGDAALALLGAEGAALVQVALPEEMVITETIETYQKLRRVMPTLCIPGVVLNRTTPPSLTDWERTFIREFSDRALGVAGEELIRAGRWESALESATQMARQRIQEAMLLPLIEVPRISHEEGSAQLVRQVAAALARSSSRPEPSHDRR